MTASIVHIIIMDIFKLFLFGHPLIRQPGKKMGKNSAVDTSFLRMNSRDAEEAAAAKEQAMREFLVRQESAKDEKFTVEYIYRSEVTQREIPNGVHRAKVQRGFTPVFEARVTHSALTRSIRAPQAISFSSTRS